MSNGIFRAAGFRRALDEVALKLGEADAAAAAGDDDRARQLRAEALRIASARDAGAAAPGGRVAPAGPAAPSGSVAPAGPAAPGDPTAPRGPAAARSGPAGPGDAAASTAALQAAVDRGHRLANRPTLRRDDLVKLHANKSEEKRVLGLAILQRRPELGDLALLREAVAGSRGDFEHAQGLAAAEAAIVAGTLEAGDMAALREEIRTVLASGRLDGTDRARMAERILGA